MKLLRIGLTTLILHSAALGEQHRQLGQIQGHACPPDQPHQAWLHSPSTQSCTTIMPVLQGSGTNVPGVCRMPPWRFGSRVDGVTLHSASEASALASHAAAHGVVGPVYTLLQVDAGSSAWAWQGGGSNYGVSDPTAWVSGVIPTPAAGLCGSLRLDGLLEALRCPPFNASTWTGTAPYIACSIPACDTASETAAIGQFWDGHTCVPSSVQYGITHYAIFRGGARVVDPDMSQSLTVDIEPGLNAAVGCGTPVNSSMELDALFSSLDFLPGDVLRVCGNLTGRRVSLHSLWQAPGQLASLEGRTCDSLQKPEDECQEVVHTRMAVASLRLGRALVGGDNFFCALLSSPSSAVRCWGVGLDRHGNASVLQGPPAGLPPASALVSAGSYVCSLLPYGRSPFTRCWGHEPTAQEPAGIPSVSALAGGGEYLCAVSEGGVVSCWGDGLASTGPPPIAAPVQAISLADNYMCWVLAYAGNIECWGREGSLAKTVPVPPELPQAFALSLAQSYACMIAAGTGSVHCWGSFAAGVPATVPADLPPAAHVYAFAGRTCVVLAGSGRLRCWNATADLPLPANLGPVAEVAMMSRSLPYMCAVLLTGRLRCWDGQGQDTPAGFVPVDLTNASVALLAGPSPLSVAVNPGGGMVGQYSSAASLVFHNVTWSVPGTGGQPGAEKMFIHLRRAETDAAVDDDNIILHHTFASGNAVALPAIRVWTQVKGTNQPPAQPCSTLLWLTAYQLRCDFSGIVYGIGVTKWNGTSMHVTGMRSPAVFTGRVSWSSTPLTVGLRARSVDTLKVLRDMDAVLNTSGRILEAKMVGVRPRDNLLWRGSGFGLDPTLLGPVPWYTPPNGSRVRSCIFLVHWASRGAYHDDADCRCNGQEDWVGEGEVPSGLISEWDDSFIRIDVPPGHGVKEIRLCIEGKGAGVLAGQLPLSQTSSFIVYEPPMLADILPSRYVESTERDSPASLLLAINVWDYLYDVDDLHGADEDIERYWGRCNRTVRQEGGRVWVDGYECAQATTTQSSGFASVICKFPSEFLSGGDHTVILQMTGINTTSSRGKLSSTCAEGYYNLVARGRRGKPSDNLCLPCPTGSTCKEGTNRMPDAERGFYNLGTAPKRESGGLGMTLYVMPPCPPKLIIPDRPTVCIVPCDPPEACIGSNECSAGYESAAPVYRCAKCSAGYYRSAGVCLVCPSITPAALALLLCVALLCILLAMLITSGATRLCALHMTLEYVQILSLLKGPGVPWPSAVQAVLQTLSLTRLNIEVVAPECIADFTPERKMGIILMLPLIVILSAAALNILSVLARAALQHWTAAGNGQGARGPKPKKNDFGVPKVSRTALRLLGALYLPCMQVCLDTWNCVPTVPSDGTEHLQIAFEPCGVPGGLQARIIPWASAGLALFGVLYPVALAVFFYLYNDLLIEDQLLRAGVTGDEPKTNPRALFVRQHFSPLYLYYRPGYHWAALFTIARRAAVCLCALMLNRAPVLVAGSIAMVMAASQAVLVTMRPYMTPGQGYAQALVQFAIQCRDKPTAFTNKVQSHLNDIAVRYNIPALRDHFMEQLPASASHQASLSHADKWWHSAGNWNALESELQLQVVFTGMLGVLYSGALGSVYESRAGPVLTVLFFLLQTGALAHIGLTVSCDLLQQGRELVAEHKQAVEEGRPFLLSRCGRLLTSACSRWTGALSRATNGVSGVSSPDKAVVCEWTANSINVKSRGVPEKVGTGGEQPVSATNGYR